MQERFFAPVLFVHFSCPFDHLEVDGIRDYALVRLRNSKAMVSNKITTVEIGSSKDTDDGPSDNAAPEGLENSKEMSTNAEPFDDEFTTLSSTEPLHLGSDDDAGSDDTVVSLWPSEQNESEREGMEALQQALAKELQSRDKISSCRLPLMRFCFGIRFLILWKVSARLGVSFSEATDIPFAILVLLPSSGYFHCEHQKQIVSSLFSVDSEPVPTFWGRFVSIFLRLFQIFKASLTDLFFLHVQPGQSSNHVDSIFQ